jgi:ribulose-5-phosphate 4-epimerase/fuculose-1-phosphate aldolase
VIGVIALGTVDAGELSLIDEKGRHLDGPPPSKEAFLHAAILRSRPGSAAVVHTHSTHSVAVSCLAGLDPSDALPPLTAYFALRVGRLPLLPYYAPGDLALEETAERMAKIFLLLRGVEVRTLSEGQRNALNPPGASA